jgi:hypothetical protein
LRFPGQKKGDAFLHASPVQSNASDKEEFIFILDEGLAFGSLKKSCFFGSSLDLGHWLSRRVQSGPAFNVLLKG